MSGWEHFPDRKGFVVGFILMGFGLGAFFFGFLSTHLIQSADMNKYPDPLTGQHFFTKEVADKVPHMLRVLCLCYAILSMVGISLVTRNPKFIQ